MERITRSVDEMTVLDRTALERIHGRPLAERQRLVIQVVEPETTPGPQTDAALDEAIPELPEWCRVYEGLSEEEIAELERTILTRANLSRPSGECRWQPG